MLLIAHMHDIKINYVLMYSRSIMHNHVQELMSLNPARPSLKNTVASYS